MARAASRRRRRALLAIMLAPIAGLFAGCASTPVPTTISITLQAGEGLNPDIHRRPSPVVVRVYQLRSVDSFGAADFMSLYERDQATLGADLVSREEMTLKPGETRVLEQKAAPDVKYLAVLAGYRELESATWKANLPVSAGARNAVNIKLQPKAIQATKATP